MVILVVEDEAIIAYCSAAMLEDAGHAVLGPAHTSAEALELARKRKPDVAVIDIDLEIPGAGVGLARHLRSQFGTAIVFATGQADAARAHSDMAVAVLAKPYDPADLPGVVEQAMPERSRQRRAGLAAYFSQLTTPSREDGVAVPARAVLPR
jgi:two-component system, response regulator PdtaR